MLWSDARIRDAVKTGELVITPFSEHTKIDQYGRSIPSFGLSSTGYDLSLGAEFRIIDPDIHRTHPGLVVDMAKDIPSDIWKTVVVTDIDGFVMPPGQFALAVSREYMKLPRNVQGICHSKSTMVRVATPQLTSPLESEWCGYVTIELVNHLPVPVRIYPGQGIAQVVFHQSTSVETSYADRSGKYQDQRAEVTLPRL